jgi:hypothetical protein
LRIQFSFLLFARLYRKAGFNRDQPRDELGRWTGTGADRNTGNTLAPDDRIVVAGYSWGLLIAQSPAGLGALKCFYQFSFGVVVVDGPVLGGCPAFVPSSAVTHGRLIPHPANDR